MNDFSNGQSERLRWQSFDLTFFRLASFWRNARAAVALSACTLLLSGCGARAASMPASADGSFAVQRVASGEMEEAAEEAIYFDDMATAPGALPSAPPSAKTSTAGGAPVGADVDAGSVEPMPASDTFVEEPPSSARRPLLIYTAELGLGVFRVQENLDTIEKMAVDAGGYLVSRGDSRVMVRVPAQDFERTVDAILKMGDVHRREIFAHDVTSEYTDLQIRLKNALAMRTRLEELLQKAVDVKEALKVEEQLGRVAEQIEMMKGRLKMLRELTSYSTITVEFSERSAPIDSRVELPFEFLDELGLGTLLNL